MPVAAIGPTATLAADETTPRPPTPKDGPVRLSVRERSEAFEAQKRYMEDRFRSHRPQTRTPSD